MNEREIDAEQIREEHLGEVNQFVHWAYLGAVLVGGTVLMVVLIALMGAS